MQVSMVIPAYNEEKNIGKFLSELLVHFPSDEVIVVCNGCTDRTPEIVKNFKRKNIRLLVFREKIGKGAAIVEGFKCARASYVGFVDADGTFSYKEIKKILKRLKYADCVIASKWKGQKFSSVDWPIARKVASRIWNFLVNFFLRLNLEDTQAGLKFVRRKVLDSIDLNFICKGYEFDIEFLSKIRRKKFKIEEVLTPVKKSENSSFRYAHILKMFFNLLRVSLKI